MTAYYPDSPFDSNFFSSSAQSEGFSAFDSYSNPLSSSIPVSGTPSSENPPSGFPLFDPESPFNGGLSLSRSLRKDGGLKNKLMGIGSDGGFLTSPLVDGNPKLRTSTHAGDIQIASPAATMGRERSSFGASVTETSAVPTPKTPIKPAGMGMGITGVTELQAALEMGDYSNPNMRIYGLPRAQEQGGMGYLPYPENLPTTTLGRGREKSREIPQTPTRESRFYEQQAFQSPPPPPGPIQAPMTGRRPRKSLTIRTMSRARSCGSLQQQAAAHSTYGMAPLTPISANGPSFYGLTEHPYIANDGIETLPPISFGEMYNLGLATDDTEVGIKKQQKVSSGPVTYANDELQIFHGLPTPFLAHNSGFSSPSQASFPGDPSPELISGFSIPMDQPHLSSSSSLSAPSMQSANSIGSSYSMHSEAPAPAGRQRCVNYNPTPATAGIEAVLDPLLLSPSHQHLASPGPRPSPHTAQGLPPRYSYPTRYASEHGHAGPYQSPPQPVQWQSPVPPVQAMYGLPPVDPVQLFGMPGQYQSPPLNPNMSNYERNLETFEDIYDSYSGGSTGYSTPNKRGREDDDEDHIEGDDGSGDYMPLGPTMMGTRAKRLRTVASAPCLPTASKRMRPGPKPKATKSPQEAHQSVFSAILSPPTAHRFRRATSPYADEAGAESSEELEHIQGVSTVPKEVIQSLYSSVPSHMASNGQKVAKRYVCLIEACERTFPRKSAIESHIQTHLEDKPFICTYSDCDASFVRQHDLRRHERIHSGNKPFPCPCGKGFARGDALARHRARGICSGSLVPRRV